jgi:hypothetical protein
MVDGSARLWRWHREAGAGVVGMAKMRDQHPIASVAERKAKVTSEMIEAGVNELFSTTWGESDEDRVARIFLAMEWRRPK